MIAYRYINSTIIEVCKTQLPPDTSFLITQQPWQGRNAQNPAFSTDASSIWESWKERNCDIRCSLHGCRPLVTIIKESGVRDSRTLFRWIQSIIILTGMLNENPTEFGNRRLSDNADHLFEWQMKHLFAKPNERAYYCHASHNFPIETVR